MLIFSIVDANCVHALPEPQVAIYVGLPVISLNYCSITDIMNMAAWSHDVSIGGYVSHDEVHQLGRTAPV